MAKGFFTSDVKEEKIPFIQIHEHARDTFTLKYIFDT